MRGIWIKLLTVKLIIIKQAMLPTKDMFITEYKYLEKLPTKSKKNQNKKSEQ